MAEIISPAEQVTRVATLLGRAVLRWKRESERSSEFSENVSNSLPERLEFSPVSSLSVTGQNDEATGLEETGLESETNSNNHVRGATNKDRGLNRRGDLATREQAGRAKGGPNQRAGHATKRCDGTQQQGGR
jgi:phosphatidate phosphatase PAH1